MQVPPQLIATSVAGGAGAAALAAHTVVRQLFEFWGLIFTAFNIATQSLVAAALAKVNCTSQTRQAHTQTVYIAVTARRDAPAACTSNEGPMSRLHGC